MYIYWRGEVMKQHPHLTLKRELSPNPYPPTPPTRPRVHYSSIPTHEKPLPAHSQSVKKEQIVEVNLSHIHPSRLYSPLATKSGLSHDPLREVSESRQHIGAHRIPNSQPKVQNDSIQHGGDVQSASRQIPQLTGTLALKEQEISELRNRLQAAQRNLERVKGESEANLFYYKLTKEISELFGEEEISLFSLKDKVEELLSKSNNTNTPSIHHLEQELGLLRHTLREEEEVRISLSDKLRQILQKQEQLQHQRGVQQQQLLTSDSEKRALMEKMQQLNKDNEKLQAEVQGLRSVDKSDKSSRRGEEREQELMNLRIHRQQLEGELGKKRHEIGEMLRLKTQQQELHTKQETTIRELLKEVETLSQLRENKATEADSLAKSSSEYLMEIHSGKRQLIIQQSEYESLKKSYLAQIDSLGKIKDQLVKELDKEHQFRIASDEASREKQIQIARQLDQIGLLEKESTTRATHIRGLESQLQEETNAKIKAEKTLEQLETEILKQNSLLAETKKSYSIEKNERERDYSIKYRMETEPLKKRIQQLQVLSRKYEGVIRELESSTLRPPESLKDARTIAHQIEMIARSQEHSQSKLSHLERLIREVVETQSFNAEKISVEVSASLMSLRQDDKRHSETLSAKERQIGEDMLVIKELQKTLEGKKSDGQNLERRVEELNGESVALKGEMDYLRQSVGKYAEEIKRYKSKLEAMEKLEVVSNNNAHTSQQLQAMVEAYQKQIAHLEAELIQKERAIVEARSYADTAFVLENRLKDSQTRHCNNIRSLEEAHRSQTIAIKEAHHLGLKNLEDMFNKSRQQQMIQLEGSRVEMNQLVADRNLRIQELEDKIRSLEAEVRDTMVATERHATTTSYESTIRQLNARLRQFQLRAHNQQQLKEVIQQIQTQNQQLQHEFQLFKTQIHLQQQQEISHISNLNLKQVQQITLRLESTLTSQQTVERDIELLRRENEELKRKNCDLNFEMVRSLPEEGQHKTLLEERNHTVLRLQQQLQLMSNRCQTLREESAIKEEADFEEFMMSRSAEFTLEKENINLKTTLKMQQLRINELTAELSHLRQSRALNLTSNSPHNSRHLEVDYHTQRVPISTKISSTPSSVSLSNDRISSLERTFEATKVLLDSNRRTSYQIKSQLPILSNYDSSATIKQYNQRIGGGSAEWESPSWRVQTSGSGREMVYAPTVRSSHVSTSRMESGQREEARELQIPIPQFQRVDNNSGRVFNFSYSKHYESKGTTDHRNLASDY